MGLLDRKIGRFAIVIIAYIGYQALVRKYGYTALFPLRLFVVFLHEFGHAFATTISGGDVVSFKLRPNGSGVVQSRGGFRWLTVMGGYVGSALFGNIIFYFGVKGGNYSRVALCVIGLCMLAPVFLWYASLYTKFTMLIFSLIMWGLAYKKWLMPETLMFLGMASVFHIIENFDNGLITGANSKYGLTGDIARYAEMFPLIPAVGWMYIWLAIVFVITAFNIRMILKQDKKDLNKPV